MWHLLAFRSVLLCALQLHATPQLWTPSKRVVLNQITQLSLCRQWWEKNLCNVSIENRRSHSPASSADVFEDTFNCLLLIWFSCPKLSLEKGSPVNEAFISLFIYVCFIECKIKTRGAGTRYILGWGGAARPL